MATEATREPTDDFVDPVEILLVDDDQAWTRGTARLLENANDAFSVTSATSLTEGHEQYAPGEFDCLVCDYQLGDGTGLDLLETVRDREPDRPFILVTGRGDENVASLAIRNDITDYVIKERDDDTELLADCVASAVSSDRAERALERERRSKSTLLELLAANTDETTLCHRFCSLLVDNHGYTCAWIGTSKESGLVASAAAGTEGYVDELLHKSAAIDNEPTIEAIKTDETVVREVPSEPTDPEPSWQPLARNHDFETAAGVPLDYEGVQFGVLGVYAADRPTIDDTRIESLAEFADTLGYALQSAEFKQSRASDRSVHIEIEINDTTAPLVAFEQSLSKVSEFIVPSVLLRDDGTTVYLVRIEEISPPAVEAAVDASDQLSFAEGQTTTETDTFVQCGVVVDEPTPESLLAEQGVHVGRIRVESGSKTIAVQLSEQDTVSTVAETLKTTYDDVVVSSVRQDHQTTALGTVESLLDPLTDKQYSAIEHAYYGGFFEHPRDTTATELAAQFDVTRQTITHHLRAGERKLLGQLFDQ